MDAAAANDLGMNVRNVTAASLSLSENTEFAKLLFSIALTAQASNRNIHIQMRGSLGGYPKVDRIWLAK